MILLLTNTYKILTGLQEIIVTETLEILSFKAHWQNLHVIEHGVKIPLQLFVTVEWPQVIQYQLRALSNALIRFTPLLLDLPIIIDAIKPLINLRFVYFVSIVLFELGKGCSYQAIIIDILPIIWTPENVHRTDLFGTCAVDATEALKQGF